jgi:SulP family sulfate permease
MRVLVLDAPSVNDLDSSADRALQEIADDVASWGVDLDLANVKGLILDVMRRSGVYDHLRTDHFFLSTDEAVNRAERMLPKGGEIRLDVRDEVPLQERL